tara:strand:+ start:968 stop:1786 length:819 start_codon:yes stop_codon:yes gene_type:complete
MRVLITGASRGIGRAIATRFAERYGSDLIVGLLARSGTTPVHWSLEGSLRDTARDVSYHGSTAFQLPTDLRDVTSVRSSISQFIHAAGGLDVLVNNASALVPNPRKQAEDKSMSLLYEVNTRGTMVCLDACRDALRDDLGSVVTVSPPIRMGRLQWLRMHGVPYTVSKYSMTLATLAEAQTNGVRANCIWPRHMVSTASTERLERMDIVPGAHSNGRDAMEFADAVVRLAVHDTHRNAQCVFDDDVLPSLPHTQSPLGAYAEQRLEPRMRQR